MIQIETIGIGCLLCVGVPRLPPTPQFRAEAATPLHRKEAPQPMDSFTGAAYIRAMTAAPLSEKHDVSLATLMAVFFRVGLTSFGGSTAAWVHREIVEKRHWLDEEGFLTALTLSQVLPGANPVNLSLYVGSMLRGGMGGIAASIGLVGPAFCIILSLGLLYSYFGNTPMAHAVLGGLAAAGVGMTLMVAVKLTKAVRDLFQAVVAIAVFVTVGLLHWATIPVVAVAGPLSIAIQAIAAKRRGAA
jgi:chromate transporter